MTDLDKLLEEVFAKIAFKTRMHRSIRKWIGRHTPGSAAYHERFCSRAMSPCRCQFDNDADYEKYGDSFTEIK